MSRCITLVISLPERLDRRKYILENFARINHDFLFIDGNQPKDMPINMQSSAIAIWSSHVLALENFLKTDKHFALILEDDVFLEDEGIKSLFANLDKFSDLLSENFTILQLGTMDFVSHSRIRAKISAFYFRIFRHYRYDKRDLNSMRNYLGGQQFKVLKRQLSEVLGLTCVPLLGFKIGAQAYLVNRYSAEWIIHDFKLRNDWDLSSRFSIDTRLEELGNCNDSGPVTLRLSSQTLVQRKTPSDNNHYKARK